MKFFSASILLTGLSALAVAAPTSNTTVVPEFAACAGGKGCLNKASALYLVDGFASLLRNYTNATANVLLAADLTDTSDSINWLAGQPLGNATFPSKTAFEAGAGSQPPLGFTVLSIDAITCKHIAFRWEATLAPGLTPIKGINILYAEKPKAKWQIQSIFSEFNSGLWKQQLCQIGAVPASQCNLLTTS